MKVTVIIKGTKQDAIDSANKQGMTLERAKELRFGSVIAETFSDPDTLNKWFTQQSTSKEYPNGTLMHWAPVEG